jgi:hypothetical protein
MESIRGILRAINQPANAEATATVQLVGLGSLGTFVDGIAISHASPPGQLVPAAGAVVHLADRHDVGRQLAITFDTLFAAAPAAAGAH